MMNYSTRMQLTLVFMLLSFSLFSCNSISASVLEGEREIIIKPQQSIKTEIARFPEPEGKKNREIEVNKRQSEEEKADNEKRLYENIKSLALEREFDKALGSVNQYNSEYGEGKYFTQVLYEEGNIYSQIGEHKKINEVKLKMAYAYFNSGEWEKAVSEFSSLLSTSNFENNIKADIHRTIGDAFEKMARYTDALKEYKKSYAFSQEVVRKKEIMDRIKTLLEQKINWETDLNKAIEILKDIPGESYAMIKLARILIEKENYTSAFFLLQHFQSRFSNSEFSEEVNNFIKKINLKKVKHVTKIVSLVPLSGDSAITGRRILNGLQLAFSEVAQEEGIKLIVKNSVTDREKIAVMLEEFVKDENVIAIIGPAFSEEIKDILPAAAKGKMVLFSPTASSTEITGISPFFFRNSTTAKNEAEYMAEIAVDYLGLSRVAIFYQNDINGNNFKKFFGNRIKELGSTVVKDVSFETNQHDFGTEIAKIGGLSDNEITNILSTGKSLPDFGFDGIFIPGNAKSVSLILPQLAYYNIDNIPILGSSELNTPEIIKSENLYSQNIFFSDVFFSDAESKEVKRFIEKYKNFFNEYPDRISAQSFDTANILIKLIRDGALTRESIKVNLQKLKGYSGITGETSFSHLGDAEKIPYLLTIKKNSIQSITPGDL